MTIIYILSSHKFECRLPVWQCYNLLLLNRFILLNVLTLGHFSKNAKYILYLICHFVFVHTYVNKVYTFVI